MNDTINIAVDLILENNPGIENTKKDLTKLFEFATKYTHFSFNGNIFDQIDGVAMGSPLAPTLANLIMGYCEKKWLAHQRVSKVLFYRRYIDDILCIFKNESDVDDFYSFINTQHPNIRFTFEKEIDKKLPFLDV